MVKVSVIIPAYNVGPYIEKCIRSIQHQTYGNIEIIIIDDGSTDETPKILDDLQENDKRICVIHKENEGVSTARNIGIERSNGYYIMFVDGDDYIEEDCISYFVKLIKKDDCDMAISRNMYTIFNQKQVLKDTYQLLDSMQVVEEIYLAKIREAVWNKLYKKSFLIEHNVQFDKNIWFGEGMLFNIRYLQNANKVIVGKRKVYHQTYNPDSAMRNFKLENNYCGIRSLIEQRKFWREDTERLENAWTYHYRCFSLSILRGLIKTKQVKQNKYVYKECIRNLRSNISIPLKVNISPFMKCMFLAMSISPVLVTKVIVYKEKVANKKARALLDET